MNTQVLKAQVGCLTILIIMILLVSYFAVGSFNPRTVYTSGSILAIITISLLALLIVVSLFQLLAVFTLRKSLEIATNKKADDIICPGCGLPLIQFISSHGTPIQCPKCKNWWHSGPACYNKNLPPGTGIFHFCYHCRSNESAGMDFFDKESHV